MSSPRFLIQLNELVASEVMGWDQIKKDIGIYGPSWEYFKGGEPACGYGSFLPTTNTGDAERMDDAIRERGFRRTLIDCRLQDDDETWLHQAKWTDDEKGMLFSSLHRDQLIGRCLAALKAIGVHGP